MAFSSKYMLYIFCF